MNFKKYASIILVIVLASCSKSKDDIPLSVSKYIIPEKVIQGSSITTFSYNENQILEINSPKGKQVFTYTDDLITKIEYYNIDGLLVFVNSYTYENQRLKTKVRKSVNGDYESTTIYQYKGNNYDFTFKIINPSLNLELKTGIGTIVITDGNISQKYIKTFEPSKNSSTSSSTTYVYDNKYNYLKNILGFNLLIDDDSKCRFNNLILFTEETMYWYDGKLSDTKPIATGEVKMQYNSNNYVTEIQGSYNGQGLGDKVLITYL